jgi:hypothetical protein
LLGAVKQSLEVNVLELGQQTVAACDRLGWEEIGEKTADLYREVRGI